MKVSVLIENTTKSKLCCEHGLSLFIEHEGDCYLLDAGQSGAFMRNAVAMQVPLQEIKCGILSHGHYDHAGGLGSFFEENKEAKVYAMKQVKNRYYSGSGETIHYIGIPEEIITVYDKRFVYVESITRIAEDVYLIPHSTKNLETIGARTKLYRKLDDELVADDFSHELSLVFDTEKGLVIFNSCSHGGIQNIIEEVKALLPNKKLYAFFGGLHMKGTSEGKEICTFSKEEVQQLTTYLRKQKLQMLCTGHCTGTVGYEMLKNELGEIVISLHTGAEFVL